MGEYPLGYALKDFVAIIKHLNWGIKLKTIVIAFCFLTGSLVYAKKSVSVEALDNQRGTAYVPWQVPGNVTTNGNSATYTNPQTYRIPIYQVWVKAKIDGRNATLWCSTAWRACKGLYPGHTYNGELNGDTIVVSGSNFEGNKTKKIKYKIVGAW